MPQGCCSFTANQTTDSPAGWTADATCRHDLSRFLSRPRVSPSLPPDIAGVFSKDRVIGSEPLYPGLWFELHTSCTTSARNGRISEPARHGGHETLIWELGTHFLLKMGVATATWNRHTDFPGQRLKFLEHEAIMGISSPDRPLPLSLAPPTGLSFRWLLLVCDL